MKNFRLQCNHFPTEEPSCRFYALEQNNQGKLTGSRAKVHVDGEVNFDAVAVEFSIKGVSVTTDEIRAAYEP